ncbi:permease-like cell division protein FtsX [Facklamia hominis]|uniref:permease-like cell division protein FtsX n=1 Tax=Facklamia hominis TaxID=178214 RepID=UPI00101C4D50|nr:permease-like cell division protein FtsX [Facklamia hominis]RYC98493.1 ABC transporter permease [Facklamia hominis]
MKAVRSFFRHLRDAGRNFTRNGWMTTASVVMMSVTLFFLGLFFLVAANVEQLTHTVENEIQIRVTIDPIANVEEQKELGEQITQIPAVSRVVYRSAQEELEEYKDVITEDFDVLNDENPLNDMYLVTVTSADKIDEVSNKISDLDYVLSASVGSLDISGLVTGVKIVRYVIALLAAIFIILAVILISNTIRLAIQTRSREIEIMQLVGAKRSYIRAPFTIEGAVIGMLGALFASVTLYASYQGLITLAQEFLAFNPKLALPIMPCFIYLAVALILFGSLLGVVGAMRSVRRLVD